MRNRCEYLVALAACFKARLVHVNVNYRYLDDELHYILHNSDARFAIYGDEFVERADALRGRLPGLSHWLQIGGEAPDFAEDLGALCAAGEVSGWYLRPRMKSPQCFKSYCAQLRGDSSRNRNSDRVSGQLAALSPCRRRARPNDTGGLLPLHDANDHRRPAVRRALAAGHCQG